MFFEQLPVVKAVFGIEAWGQLHRILEARQEVFAAAETLPYVDAEDIVKSKATIWKRAHVTAGKASDSIDELLDESEAELETQLQPYIN